MTTHSLHKTTHHASHESLWCPDCGDYGLVYCDHDDAEDLWKCIDCDYQVNLTKGTKQHRTVKSDKSGQFLWELLCAALIVLLFLHFTQNLEQRRSLPTNHSDPWRSLVSEPGR